LCFIMSSPSVVDTTRLVRLKTVTYIDAGSLALLVYDYFMTLESEVNLIWPSKWSFIKVLYVLTRYLPFVDVSVLPVYDTSKTISLKTCKQLYTVGSFGVVIGVAIAELILVIRTWALWGREKRIGIFLFVLYVSLVIPAFVFMIIFVNSLTFAVTKDIGCTPTGGSPLIVGDFLIIVLIETVVLGLTLGRGWYNYRGRRGLLAVLYRDGIAFYFALLTLSIVNITVVIAAPIDLSNLLTTIQRVLHSCLSARVILNLREVEKGELERSLTLNSFALRRMMKTEDTTLQFNHELSGPSRTTTLVEHHETTDLEV